MKKKYGIGSSSCGKKYYVCSRLPKLAKGNSSAFQQTAVKDVK